jgi:hypothetical protein
VLAELKKLREGRGLNPERLGKCAAVLAALGVSDPREGVAALQFALHQLGDGDRVRALKVDLGLDLQELLGRPPVTREMDWLGERRSAYAEVIGRDVKTLARWSDRTLEELRAHLSVDKFDGQVIITAGVQSRRINGVEVMRFDNDDIHLTHGTNTGITNPEPGSSLPLVLYGFPGDWRPSTLRFAIAFIDEHPQKAWALVIGTVINIGFGHERTELEIVQGLARYRIDQPRQDQLYGVWWEW